MNSLPHRAALVFCLAFGVVASAQEVVPPLTFDEAEAVNSITEGRVLSTVSFLASDEMAGRDTPSRELTIAESYVAARFRGAGLEGLGPDGSYFQEASFPMVQPPATDATIQVEGSEDSTNLIVLTGPKDRLQLTGVVLAEPKALAATDPRIAIIDEVIVPPQAIQQPAKTMALLARRTRALEQKGVQVVLIRCQRNSVLRELAAKLQQTPTPNRAGLIPECGVLLVAADSELTNNTVTIDVDAQIADDAVVRNVVGVLRGNHEELRSEAVLISAHLDHIGRQQTGPDKINNGADDNATGVTTVLSLADAFAALESKPKRSVVFVTFWGEEKGLLGSKHFVEHPLWPLSSIVANINIEMVGRPETDARQKAWMTGWKHSNLGDVINTGSSRVGVEIFNREDVGEMLYTRSDNHPFAQKGVVAHSISAGSLHSDYHQPSDEWQKLDLPHMTKVIQGVFAGALVVASGDVEVKRTEK